MFEGNHSRALLTATLGAAWFFASACVHPLGPGYDFSDRQTEIRVSEGAAGGIRFRVVDRLHNNGDRPLRTLEVRLPEGLTFGNPVVKISIEGKEVSPQEVSKTDPRRRSTPFDPPWKEDENREITSEWDLAPVTLARGTIAASSNGFFIADETALPLWQTPRGVFSHGGEFPDKEILTISVPAGFRVLAPGKPLKPVTAGNEKTLRYQLLLAKSFVPYVVAGNYKESVIPTKKGDVQFWSFQPIDTQTQLMVAQRLASSMKALADFFGPPAAEKLSVRVVESPVELTPEFSEVGDFGAVSFPEGVFLDTHTVQGRLPAEQTLELAEYALARTWFGWVVRPTADAQILLGRGIGLFGEVIAAENRGANERTRMIQSLMERYDAARALAPDKRLMEPPSGYSHAERVSTGYRAALFYVALEDLCGRDKLSAAMRDVVQSRAGSDSSYQELRSAVESASGKDLAEMFREWLIQPGIPSDFRARYQKTSTARRN